VSFAAITLCVASQRVSIVIVVYFVTTQSGYFWIQPRIVPHVLYPELSPRLAVYDVLKFCTAF